jgi:UDP-2,3-diacylglucosamine hydrolase
MPKTYFISDVHLGEISKIDEEEKVQKFLTFLKKINGDAERIFFVGDLFDFWFEYKFTIPKKHFSVLHQLALLQNKKIEMHYLAGNHDFFLGNFFEKELNIRTYSNEWTGKIYGKNFYIFHGDGVAKKDTGYRILKKIIRNPVSIKLYRLIHPDIGIPLARFISGSSRIYTDNIKLDDQNDYIEFARERFKEGFDYVIMGHRHEPFVLNEKKKKYINLGDWLVHFSYAVFDGNNIELKIAE